MTRLKIGTIYNTAETTVVVNVSAEGFMVDAAVFPFGVLVKNAHGKTYYPRRGEVCAFPSHGSYAFVYPDTWAGNIDSTFGQISTYFTDYDRTKDRLGGGEVYAVFLESQEELRGYKPPRKLAPVYFIPKLESIAGNESYHFNGLDYGRVEMVTRCESSGYYANWFVFAGARPSGPSNIYECSVLSFMQTQANTVADIARNHLSIAGQSTLGLLCYNSDAAGSERVAWAMAFYDEPQEAPVIGCGHISFEATLNGVTVTYDMPLPPAASYTYQIYNDGANNATNVGVDNLLYNVVDDVYELGASILTDATLTPAEAQVTKQSTSAQAIRWRATSAAATTVLFSLYVVH